MAVDNRQDVPEHVTISINERGGDGNPPPWEVPPLNSFDFRTDQFKEDVDMPNVVFIYQPERTKSFRGIKYEQPDLDQVVTASRGQQGQDILSRRHFSQNVLTRQSNNMSQLSPDAHHSTEFEAILSTIQKWAIQLAIGIFVAFSILSLQTQQIAFALVGAILLVAIIAHESG